MNRLFYAILIVTLGLLLAGALATAEAEQGCGCGQGCASCHHGSGHGGGCCDRCGGCCQVKKVCRLVCETKEVKIDCWGCKCEDFCIPCPSHKRCTCCECVCGECGLPGKSACCCWDKVWALPKKFVYSIWQPCGACVHTRKVLMHRVEIKKVPVYRWEVEYLCPRCECDCCGAAMPANLEYVPEPPCQDATFKYQVPADYPPPVPGHTPMKRTYPKEDKAPTPPPLKLESKRQPGPLGRVFGE